MASSLFTQFLRSIAADLEQDIDRIDDLLSQGEGHERRVRVLAYAGYRNADTVRVSGRVVRFENDVRADGGTLRKLRAMIAIYNSRELPGVPVRCEGYGQSADTVSDDEGYFSFELAIAEPLPLRATWESVTLSTPRHSAQSATIEVPVIAPGKDHHWGIISDIDDTVVETGATDFRRNWRRVLAESPRDRIAVPGVAGLYKMIAGDLAGPARPFFYVSSSPWNLYGFIAEFMEHNAIPHGPMFLKDYGLDRTKFIHAGHDEHKLEAIERILGFYPDMRFLLIGDNGQRDVTIYARAVADFPTRVAAVFIRDVDGSCRDGPEGELLKQISAAGVPTFCGTGFEDALGVATLLEMDRPAEVAKAAIEQAPGRG